MFTLKYYVILTVLFVKETATANTKNKISTTVIIERSSLECDNVNAVECVTNVRRWNRTSPYILNLETRLVHGIRNDTMVSFRSYEWKDNQYKESFVRFDRTLCDFLDNDNWLAPAMKEYMNIAGKCPFKPMKLIIKDFHLKSSAFLPGFPMSKWKFAFKILRIDTKTQIALFEMEFRLSKVASKT